MGFFRRAGNTIARFMYGRYGVDQLSWCLLIVYAVLSNAVQCIPNRWVHQVAAVVVWAIPVWMIYRILSRRLEPRRRENERFLGIWRPVKQFFKLQWCRIRDIKTHRYFRCKHCRAVVRLVIKRGKHSCTCPRCQRDFTEKM